MKSALECFLHAEKCEQMSRQALDNAARSMLLTIAEHWRTLGNTAKASDGREADVPGPDT
jgi:hypothetical protein